MLKEGIGRLDEQLDEQIGKLYKQYSVDVDEEKQLCPDIFRCLCRTAVNIISGNFVDPPKKIYDNFKSKFLKDKRWRAVLDPECKKPEGSTDNFLVFLQNNFSELKQIACEHTDSFFAFMKDDSCEIKRIACQFNEMSEGRRDYDSVFKGGDSRLQKEIAKKEMVKKEIERRGSIRHKAFLVGSKCALYSAQFIAYSAMVVSLGMLLGYVLESGVCISCAESRVGNFTNLEVAGLYITFAISILSIMFALPFVSSKIDDRLATDIETVTNYCLKEARSSQPESIPYTK